MTELLDRIRGALVGLRMPRALEALAHTLQQLEKGEITAIEAIDSLLSEEYATRETLLWKATGPTSGSTPPTSRSDRTAASSRSP